MGARDVVFTILAIDEASRTLEKVGLGADVTGGKLGKLGSLAGTAFAGVALAAGAAAVKGVELGMDFQASMEQLHTQAGVAQGDVDSLSGKVLDLAGKVGTDPDSLAQALYHVESSFASTGIKGDEAMHLLQTAAEGAKVGHADLVDVTNALDAAVVSGIPGVKNFDQAMGALNATVGSGDMTMQDLAEAFGGGAIAAVKTYGLSLRDVSAALAVFGDNNIRGADAGTALRMTVQSLAVPAKEGKDALARLGLQTDTLGKAMQHGGLSEAISVLVDHLHKAGIKGDETGQILTEAFGKKAGTGINVLVDQYDRLKSKYGEIDKASKGFGESWASQQKTFKQEWDQFKATIDALLTKLGLVLIPMLQSTFSWLGQLGGQVKTAFDGVGKSEFMAELAPKLEALGGKLSALWDTIKAAVAQVWPHVVAAFDKIKAAVEPVISKIADTLNKDVIPALSGLVEAIAPVISWLVDKLAPIVAKVFSYIGTVIEGALKIISGIINVVTGIITGNWGKAWDGIKQIVSGVWDIIKGLVTNGLGIIEDLLSGAASALWHIGKALFEGLWNGMKSMWGAITGWVSDMAHKLPDWIRGPLGISSPSRVFHAIGTNIVGGLLAGFRATEPEVASYLKAFSDRISAIKVSPKVEANLKQFAGGIAAGIAAGSGDVQDALADVIPIRPGVAVGGQSSRLAGGDTYIINLPAGMMMGTPAQLARELERTIQEAGRSGVKVNLQTA